MKIEDDKFDAHHRMMIQWFELLNKNFERMLKMKDCMEGDQLMDNQDVCHLLKIDPRTLQRYRQKKIFKYYMFDDGKCYYIGSEIREAIKNHEIIPEEE